MEAILPNPRVRRRRPTVELVRAVRDGRRVGEALGVLSAGDAEGEAEHAALAQQLARFLVRRCDERHQGWQVLRQVVLDAGGEVPWERCSRQAVGPTKDRVLRDCATPGRTPLVRVQHAAAQERARRIAALLDRPVSTVRGWLRRFGVRAEILRVLFTVLLHEFDASAPAVPVTGSGFADALQVLGLAAAAAARLFGPRPAWEFASAASGGLLLGPSLAANTS